MRNDTYISVFRMICIKESIQVEANALSLGFWPQLCSKSFSELIILKVEPNDIPAKIMISFSYWSLWKMVTNSEAELALAVLHPAVSGGPGSCCSSPHWPISRRNTEPLSVHGLSCSGAEGLAQGRTQLRDHQRVQRALVVYQHSFQTTSKNVMLKNPVVPSLDFQGIEVVLFLTLIVQQLSWWRGQTVNSYGGYVLTLFPFTE